VIIAAAIVSVLLLIILIAVFKMNAFVALILAALTAGLLAQMPLDVIAKSFSEGVGATLGSIAMVVGLGAILGKMLAESGGAESIAITVTKIFGEKRLPWAVLVIALIVGLPVFFAVGLVLLTPIIIALSRRSRVSFIKLGLPLVAGLSVAHGLIPPHPGPMLAVETLKADTAKTILYSLIIGIPAAILAGPLFLKTISFAVELPPTHSKPISNPPGFFVSILTITLPVLLMAFSVSALYAMTIAVLFSFFTFGFARGFNRRQILKFTEDCVGPVANVLLIVGAGGGFNRILVASGVADFISHWVATAHFSPLILGWSVAALIRIATGSATVAITAAAGILAPVAATQPVNLELLVIAMGSGSLILSHVNDGGFWFVKEYLNLSVTQTLRTWTVMETIIALVGLAGALALSYVV
jgi:gluconate:H+ symporter, GntP family